MNLVLEFDLIILESDPANSDSSFRQIPFPFIFQTINSARLNSQHLKYQRFTPSSCKDIGMRNLEFVASVPFRIYPN